MFIRTNDNKIYDMSKYDIVCENEEGYCFTPKGKNYADVRMRRFIAKKNIIKQSENLEELMIVGDLILKTSGELFFIPNEYAVDYYIKHHSIRRLWAKQFEVDYKLIMYTDESGKLCLRGGEL